MAEIVIAKVVSCNDRGYFVGGGFRYDGGSCESQPVIIMVVTDTIMRLAVMILLTISTMSSSSSSGFAIANFF